MDVIFPCQLYVLLTLQLNVLVSGSRFDIVNVFDFSTSFDLPGYFGLRTSPLSSVVISELKSHNSESRDCPQQLMKVLRQDRTIKVN